MSFRFRSAIIQSDAKRTADDLNAMTAAIAAAATRWPGNGRVVIASSDRGAVSTAVAGAWQANHVPVVVSEVVPNQGTIEAQKLGHQLRTAQPLVAFADEGYRDLLTEAGFVPGPVRSDVGPLRVWRSKTPPAFANPTDAALIVFTSGSTGTPKGVVHSKRSLEAIAATNRLVYRLTSSDRFLSALPMTHLAGLTNVLAATQAGADVVVAPPVAFAGEIQRFVADNEVTVAGLVPHQLYHLFGRSTGPGATSLRLIVCSGSRLSPFVAAATKRAAPDLSLVNAYGLTEAFRSFAAQVGPEDPTDIGQPVLGASARLVNPGTSEPVAVGVVGEIQLRGNNLFSGYWQPDGTLEPPPLWFPTGDLATVDGNGRFHFIGRQCSYVNVAGHKESIETIEEVLEPAAPGRLAVTHGFDDQGLERVVVVAEQRAGVDLKTLRRMARPLAPALRPTAVVEVEQLPRTAIGKIDRALLNELATIEKGQNQ